MNAVPTEVVSLTDGDWHTLLGWAVDQRVLGLLRAAAPEFLELTHLQDQQLRAATLAATSSSLHVESSVAAVADALTKASIDWRVLKGTATAHLVYPDSGLRSIGDIDLLVQPADLAAALEALSPLTAVPPVVPHGPARAKALKEYQVTDHRGVELDVHQAIEGSLLVSRLPIDALFAQPQQVRVAGRVLATMSMPALFVHAVLHLTSVGAQLSTAPDIGRLAEQCPPDDPLFDELLAARGVASLFTYGLTKSLSVTQLPGEWQDYLAQESLSATEESLLRWVHKSPTRLALVNLSTGRQRVRRVGETLWPSAGFLAHSQRTRLTHFTRLARKALH